MADEQAQGQQATPQGEATVTKQSVTDEALSSAFDAGQTAAGQQTEQTEGQTDGQQEATGEGEQTGQQEGEQQGEQQTEAGEHEEPTDNAERSRLGRRLKATEDLLASQKATLDAILAKLNGQPATDQPKQQMATPAQIPGANVAYDDSFIRQHMEAAVERGEIPGTIMTPMDQVTVNRYQARVEQFAEHQFSVNYINCIKDPKLKGDMPDEVYTEVMGELMKERGQFDRKTYAIPELDAKVNFADATNFVLQKRLKSAKPTGVFKGKPKDAPATGTSVSTRTATANADELPPLDAASLDFIKRSGMSQESVKEALKGDMPFGLRGR